MKGIQAVVQRQQSVQTEGENNGLILDGQHGGFGLLGPSRAILDGTAAAPLGDGLGIDAVSLGEASQAF